MRKGWAVCVALLGLAGAVVAVALILHDYVRAEVLGDAILQCYLGRRRVQSRPPETHYADGRSRRDRRDHGEAALHLPPDSGPRPTHSRRGSSHGAIRLASQSDCGVIGRRFKLRANDYLNVRNFVPAPTPDIVHINYCG